MRLTLRIFLENQDELIFGPGILEILQTVQKAGSLRKAVLKLGMSYRWAWGKLNTAEKKLGIPLLTRTEAAGCRPMELTSEALELVQWLSQVEKNLHRSVHRLEKTMPTLPTFLVNAVPAEEQNPSTLYPAQLLTKQPAEEPVCNSAPQSIPRYPVSPVSGQTSDIRRASIKYP